MTTAKREAGRGGGATSGLLAGKVCVVSGVGPGLGRQAARALAAQGADLVLAARRQANLDEVAAELHDLGARAITVPTNIVDADACVRLMDAAAEEYGGVDVLVNNAFRPDVFQGFEEVDLAVWRKIMDVNVFGSLQMTRAAVPQMRRRGGGSVGIEFDARQVGTPFFGYFDQRGAVADTGIDGCIRPGRNQERPNVLGLFDRQRIVTEFEPTRVPHGSSRRLMCDPLGCVVLFRTG